MDIKELVDSIEDYDEGAGWICRADDVLKVINTIRIKWLRSEIEKVEIEVEHWKKHSAGNYAEGAIDALTSIITRYKEELLELEKEV